MAKENSGHGGNRPGGPGGGHGGPHGMMMSGEKPKNAKKTLGRLVGYLKPHRLLLVLVVVAAVCSTVFNIASPIVIGDVTTELYDGFTSRAADGPGVDFDAIRRLLIIVAALYVAYSVFSYLQSFVMARIVQDIIYDLRESTKSKLDRLSLAYFDKLSTGEVLSRMVNDIDVISSTLQDTLVQTVTSAVTLVGVLVMMLSISPLMTLIAIATVPLSLLVTVVVAKRAQGFFAAQQKTLGLMNSHIEEMYGGHTVIKAFSREDEAIAEFERRNGTYYDNAWKAQFVTGVIRPAMGFIGNLGYVAVCVLGAALAVNGTIQVGQIQAFIQYMRTFSQPITQLASVSNIIQQTLAAAERVFEVLDEPELSSEQTATKVLGPVQGTVEFDHVNFGYTPGTTVIHDLSVTAQPGQTIAIVGPTGAGKTTLVNLLMRFYEIGGGAIRLDGVDTREMTRHELRSHFGMVLQETWLFAGTIRENIRYGRQDATDEEVVRAAQLAHADHFICTFPEGYDTLINEEASNISVGQKQLLTIARALLANPSVLILDEATSSIDTRTERLVQKAMGELMEDRTNFVIAHRLSTIRTADRILCIKDGDIVEQGTHDELLSLDGFYADLYNSQFVDCIDEVEVD